MRIAVNGFGRIGRMATRHLLATGNPDLELAVINSTFGLDQTALLLEFDSIHGNLPEEVRPVEGGIAYAGRQIPVVNERNPANIDWAGHGVDLVLECTGAFNDGEKAAAHLKSGAKRVLISAPATHVDRTVVYGVNHDDLTAEDLIVSNASCTTNCLAPVANILDQAFGIEGGYMTTVHAVTGDQNIIDARHPDPRRARAAYESIVPTKTGAAKALGEVLPHLSGKLAGSALRVPTANVSMIDLVFTSEQEMSVAALNQAFIDAAKSPALSRVLKASARPLVSTDYCTTTHSAIVDLNLTEVVGPKMARVVAWYDNEWAFAARMLDVACAMGAAAGLMPEKVVQHPVTFAA